MKECILKYEEKPKMPFIFDFFTSYTNLAFFYGIFLFLYEIKFLRNVVDCVHPFLLLWAFFLMAYNLFCGYYWEKIRYWKILFCFFCIAAITTLLNIETGLIFNLKMLVMLIVPVCIFFPVCIFSSSEKKESDLVKSLLGVSLVVFLASGIALVLYLCHFSQTISFMGYEELIGYRYYDPANLNSGIILYGLYVDTNHAAVYSMVIAVYSLFLFRYCHTGCCSSRLLNRIGVIYSIINFVIQISYFPLANSRGGWLCVIFALIISLFLFFFCNVLRDRAVFKRLMITIALTSVCLCVVVGGLVCVRSGFSYMSAAIQGNDITEKINHNSTFGTNSEKNKDIHSEKNKDIHSEKNDQHNLDGLAQEGSLQNIDSFQKPKSETGSGRLIIWDEAFDLFAQKPFFGTGKGNNQFFALKYDIGDVKISKGAAIHNSYLDLLVDYGLLGFLTQMGFWFFCLKDLLVCIWKYGKNYSFYFFSQVFSILFIAGTSVFLSCIFISTTASYFLFLITAGYLMSNIKTFAGTKSIKD